MKQREKRSYHKSKPLLPESFLKKWLWLFRSVLQKRKIANNENSNCNRRKMKYSDLLSRQVSNSASLQFWPTLSNNLQTGLRGQPEAEEPFRVPENKLRN